jgi:FkbM family methyltransferase
MLKAIRKVTFINVFFRTLLRSLEHIFSSLFNFFIARWPTSGIIDCTFAGYDFKLYNECDDGLVDVLYYGKKHQEESDLKLFTILAKHARVIIDIGANTGSFSILSAAVNKNACIYAIEPYSPNFARLNINLKINDCKNVKPLQVAMGESTGTVEFTVPESNAISEVSSINGEFSKSMYPDLTWKKEIVTLETMDHVRASNSIGKINLIKCDVETYEMNVFRGMDQILREDRPTILFECFLNHERQEFFNDVQKKYNYYVYGVLTEGLVYLNNGFEKNVGGLNYLLSPVPPQRNFINYEYLSHHPGSILLVEV